MKAGSILDADMATLSAWVKAGWGWWVRELRDLLPPRLRRIDRPLRAYVLYRAPGDVTRVGRGSTLPVLIDPALCLVRHIPVPPLSEPDLRRLVLLDADRIFPLATEHLVVAVTVSTADKTSATVAGLPRAAAAAMIAELRELGLAPARVGIADLHGDAKVALDMTAAFAHAGLIERRRSTTGGWWLMVASLLALNVGMLVWRDQQDVARLEALVAGQAPAVAAARTLSARLSGNRQLVEQVARRRQRHDAAGVLAAVTEALPQRAWVQRYSWDGQMVRLSGYKAQGVDVIGALRQSARFSQVRAASVESLAEVPTGQPFDLTAQVR